jgi:hypothetical protein
MPTVILRADEMAWTIRGLCAELSDLLLDAPEVLAEPINRLVRALPEAGKVIALKVEERAAVGAVELRIRAEPSDALLGFMSAIRAGDRNLETIEQAIRHLESSIGGDTPMVEGDAGAVH